MAAAAQSIGNYRLFERIGAGGMGSVYLGRLFASGGFRRIVAIKRLHPQFAADADFVTAFLDEARLASRIHHPSVVAPLDVVAQDGEVFLVFEHVLGLSLSVLLRRASERGERAPPRIAAAIMVSALHGLHAAHEATDDDGAPLHLVHRDVSPQNILVGRDGSARLLDFGIAKAAGRAQVTSEGVVKGKRSYMAPEHLLGGTTRLSDIYSASIVLWEALTGHRLFADEHSASGRVQAAPLPAPSDVVPELPPSVDAVVLRGLAHVPGERFSTAREMAIALEGLGIATAREVGDWVDRIAHADLEARARLVAAAEGSFDPSSARVPAAAALQGIEEEGATETGLVAAPALDQARGGAPVARRLAVIGGAIAIVVLAVVLVVAVGARKTSGRPASALAAEPVASGALPAAPPPSSATSTASPVAADAGPRPLARPRAVPKRAEPRCAPYVIDKDGHKQFNEACLR